QGALPQVRALLPDACARRRHQRPRRRGRGRRVAAARRRARAHDPHQRAAARGHRGVRPGAVARPRRRGVVTGGWLRRGTAAALLTVLLATTLAPAAGAQPGLPPQPGSADIVVEQLSGVLTPGADL